MQQIKDLVATDISRGLFEKIQRGISVADTTKYYISNSGSDSNDGTESKPFKTIEKCIETIRIKHGNNQLITGIDIHFLSDYENTKTIRFSGFNRNIQFYFRNESHNVVLGGFSLHSNCVNFYNITFKPKETFLNSSVHDVGFYSIAQYTNCTFYAPPIQLNYYFCCRYYSHIIFRGNCIVNLSNNENAIRGGIVASYAKGIVFHDGTITLGSDFTSASVIEVMRHGEYVTTKLASFDANGFTANAKKYRIENYSFIDLLGKGEGMLLGNKAGELLDGKVY